MGGQRWSVDELKVIREVFPGAGPVATANRLGRSLQSTKLKAWQLGISYKDNPRFWSPADVAALRRDYPRLGPDALAQALNRAPTAVRVKASGLGVHFNNPSLWSEAAVAYIRGHYPQDGPRNVSVALGRTFVSVTTYASLHGIRWINENTWTTADDEFLRVNYSRLGGKRCATALGRSLSSVQMRVHRVGIAYEQNRHWTEEQNQRLRDVFRDSLPADLEREFFRDYRAIAVQAQKLKVFRQARLGEAKRLLDGTLVSAYWLGFLLADGHFGRGYIQCGLAAKDKGHLQRLADYFGDCRLHTTKKGFSIGVGDNAGVAEVMKRFGIVERKTYEPPGTGLLASLGPEGLVAALVGFFDGDGCTGSHKVQSGERRLALGRIVCHGSWLDCLTWWSRVACDYLAVGNKAPFASSRTVADPEGIVRVSSQAVLPISVAMMRALKRFSDLHGLPVLARKWWFQAEPLLWSR